jgi:aryl-alcohol dehydrogenase-like predicted oxidoreductase
MSSGKISVLAGKNAGMPYTRLGNTGTLVSRICLGCMSYGDKKWRPWVLEEEESLPFFRRALELGINMFDTSCNYSLGVSEEITGRALRQLAHRDEIVVATKVFGGQQPLHRQQHSTTAVHSCSA